MAQMKSCFSKVNILIQFKIMIKAAKPCFSRPAELRTNGFGLSELMFKTQIETSLSCPLAQIILPVNIVFEIF